MKDLEGLGVLNPLANWVLMQLNMASCLWGYVDGSLDASIIIIGENSWQGSVKERKSGLGDATTEISEIDNLFGGGTCGTNLAFTRAERLTVLALSDPANWTAIAENDSTVHTLDFEKRQKSALRHRVSNLRVQTGIAVGQKHGRCGGHGWNSILIGFNISQRRGVYIRMHWNHYLRGKGNAVVIGRMDVM
jgi:hypothetical protein